MQETQVQFLGQEDPLEKGMATHSSILAQITGNFTDREAWRATIRGVGHDVGTQHAACMEPLQQTRISLWQFSAVQEHSLHFKHINEKSPLFIHC